MENRVKGNKGAQENGKHGAVVSLRRYDKCSVIVRKSINNKSTTCSLQPVFRQYGNHKSQQRYAVHHDDSTYGGVISADDNRN